MKVVILHIYPEVVRMVVDAWERPATDRHLLFVLPLPSFVLGFFSISHMLRVQLGTYLLRSF